MQSETWYEKKGRKYVPVAEYARIDGWPKGFHIVYVKPGSTMCKFLIEPDRANLLAAAIEHEDALRAIISDMLAMRPTKRPVTKKQAAAWQAFQETMGNERFIVEYASVGEIVDAVMKQLTGGK